MAMTVLPSNHNHDPITMAMIVHPSYHHTLPLEPVRLSFWEECCDYVLRKIAGDLGDARSLVNLQLVNKRCSRIAACDDIWRQLCVAKFNCSPSAELGDATWKDVYRFNMQAFKYLLAQSAADALLKLGIRASSSNLVVNMHHIMT